MTSTGATDGTNWLAEASRDPAACRHAWRRSGAGLMMLPAGRRWDVLTVPGTLGLTALAVLSRAAARPGPVLADRGSENVGFFVPPGTAARLLGTGLRVAGEGTWIVVPRPGVRGRGLRWLVAPDGSGRLNAPVPLELALHEAAAELAADGRAGSVRPGRRPGVGHPDHTADDL